MSTLSKGSLIPIVVGSDFSYWYKYGAHTMGTRVCHSSRASPRMPFSSSAHAGDINVERDYEMWTWAWLMNFKRVFADICCWATFSGCLFCFDHWWPKWQGHHDETNAILVSTQHSAPSDHSHTHTAYHFRSTLSWYQCLGPSLITGSLCMLTQISFIDRVWLWDISPSSVCAHSACDDGETSAF